MMVQSKIVWPDDIVEAVKLQKELRGRIRIIPLEKTPKLIAAVDASFKEETVIGVATLYSYPELGHIEDVFTQSEVRFPYVPGFLTFREGEALTAALDRLHARPDLLLVDGQGIAHPRGIGIASHIGVLLDMPTIGCAKSRLVGTYEEPPLQKGSWSPLYYKGKQVGAVVRTRSNVRPLFISPGHRIDIQGSLRVVMQCVTEFRLPEPLKRADYLSRSFKTEL